MVCKMPPLFARHHSRIRLASVGLALCLGVILLSSCGSSAQAATYYVATSGGDDHDGLSPQTPWQSLSRVNTATLKPGDRVLFRRGDQWRGTLLPVSGSEEGVVTYGAYGEGPKPAILGSVACNRPEDWTDLGNDLWSAGGKIQSTVAPPPGPAKMAFGWGLHVEGGAEAKGTLVPGKTPTDPDVYRISCTKPGTAGNQIQLITAGIPLTQGRTYRLVARVRSSMPFSLQMPRLMAAQYPWTGYSAGPSSAVFDVGPEPVTVVQYFQANTTSDNARLTFYLGAAVPAGAVLELDSMAFETCDAKEIPSDGIFPVDVGNIIFGNDESCGVKRWKLADLKNPGDYWYSERERKLYLRSDQNPALKWRVLECALRRHTIEESGRSYVTYENLALKYAGAHGIGGGSTHHITVRGCDISFIGGGDQYGGGVRTVRFGNGIEFWGGAHDNLVEGCRIWEVYDAALTNQNGGVGVKEYNLIYRNNVIYNSEYSFEYWNRPETSETYNIQFVNNTCVNAGHGWGHTQRPDPSGRQLCFYASPAQIHDVVIKNNVFYEAVTNSIYAPQWTREQIDALALDHNLWYQAAGTMMNLKDHPYTMAQFAQYQQEYQQDAHSLAADPLFVDIAAHDYRLQPGSPCIDAGTDLGCPTDVTGAAVRAGRTPDLGAYEYVARP
jgi:hypothetical protein